MPVTVTVNERDVVHRASEGLAVGVPDTCLTPPIQLPVDYVAMASSSEAVATCGTVFCDGQPVMNMNSFIVPTRGDEAGTGGGIISGGHGGPAYFVEGSTDVQFEGAGVPRHLDNMGLNAAAPQAVPNATGPILETNNPGDLRTLLCEMFCLSNRKFFKMRAFRAFLARKVSAYPQPGFWLGSYYDPIIPGVWVEVPYDVRKNPPEELPSDKPSDYQENTDHQPLGIPATWWQASRDKPRGSVVIPDVVVTKDPHKPPTADNVEKIYEVKFDGDTTNAARERQVKAQQKINRNVEVLDSSESSCNCPEKKTKKKKGTAEDKKKAKEDQKSSYLWKFLFEGLGIFGIGAVVGATIAAAVDALEAYEVTKLAEKLAEFAEKRLLEAAEEEVRKRIGRPGDTINKLLHGDGGALEEVSEWVAEKELAAEEEIEKQVNRAKRVFHSD